MSVRQSIKSLCKTLMDLHKSQVCSILLNINYYDDLEEVVECLILRHYFNEGKILVLKKLRFNEESYDKVNEIKRSYGYQFAYYNKIPKNITSDFYPSLIFKDNYLEQIPMNDKNFILIALEHLSSLSDKVEVIIIPNINEIFEKIKSVHSKLLHSFRCLKEIDIQRILSLSFLKAFNPLEDNAYAIIDIAQKEKEQLALKTGLLEWIKAPDKDEVGGLGNVRGWLKIRAKIYDNMVVAKQSGVNTPNE